MDEIIQIIIEEEVDEVVNEKNSNGTLVK